MSYDRDPEFDVTDQPQTGWDSWLCKVGIVLLPLTGSLLGAFIGPRFCRYIVPGMSLGGATGLGLGLATAVMLALFANRRGANTIPFLFAALSAAAGIAIGGWYFLDNLDFGYSTPQEDLFMLFMCSMPLWAGLAGFAASKLIAGRSH